MQSGRNMITGSNLAPTDNCNCEGDKSFTAFSLKTEPNVFRTSYKHFIRFSNLRHSRLASLSHGKLGSTTMPGCIPLELRLVNNSPV
jgi:hypothetical protein